MALTLRVCSSDTSPAPELTLDSPRIIIGRGESCDLRLPDPSVSHRHASIRQRGSEYIVMDEGSTNGTFVGPVKLPPGAPRVIAAGDLIRVGRVWLEATVTSAMPRQTPTLTKEIALRLVAEALAAHGETAAPIVTISAGVDAGKTLAIAEFGREYVIGRGDAADLSVTDADASRRHLSIVRSGEQLLVTELGSKNGTQIGTDTLRVGEAVPWLAETDLAIGKTVFTYRDPVRETLRELENTPDERLLHSDPIAPPKGNLSAGDEAKSAATQSAKVAPSPKPSRPQTTGWGLSDVLVLMLALVVLGVSSLGLYWLFKAQ
jgi:pSer/pThr/pTyr-binding forkhead associated (FHA) protein